MYYPTDNELHDIYLSHSPTVQELEMYRVYLKELPEVKKAVREYNRKNPWDYTYMWYDPGFVVETRNDYSKAMDGLNYRIDVLEDYAGYSIYDL